MKELRTERRYLTREINFVSTPKFQEYDTEKITLYITGKKPVEIKVVDESTETSTRRGDHFYIDIDVKKKQIKEDSLIYIRTKNFKWEDK